MPMYDLNPRVGWASPSRYGMLGHTLPAPDGQNTSTPVLGSLHVQRIVAEADAPADVRNVRLSKGVQGSGVTLFKTAVFDSAGAQLGVSADQSAAINTGGSLVHTIPTGSFAIVRGREYYVAFLQVGGSALALSRAASLAMINGGMTGAQLLFSIGGTALTDVPASIVPANLTAQNVAWWVGLL